MSITIDNREHSLLKCFENCEVQVQQLNIGDIHIIYDTHKIIIERKTLKDLQASIRDGRYKEQKARLLASEAEVWYIFEGLDLSNYGSVSYKAVMSAMTNCIVRDKIKVFRTKDTKETAFFIQQLVPKLEQNLISESHDYSAIPLSLNKGENITDKDIYISQLCCIPGISRILAKNIANEYDNIIKLSGAQISDLTLISKIGKKKALRIFESLRGVSII
tara:strand:- start:1148 stop:1804 length:657 start_codon:yes stop_codon:yes gene_type:complete